MKANYLKCLCAILGMVVSASVSAQTPGTLKWKYPISGYHNAPAISPVTGTIYIGSWDNKLYALNPDGTLKWTYTTGGYIACVPSIGPDGSVYVSSADKKLYAINPDGTLKWTYLADDTTGNLAIGSDGTIYFGTITYNSYLYAVKPDGTLKWQFPIVGQAYNSPAVASDGTIYIAEVSVAGTDILLHAVTPAGTEKWNFATDTGLSSPAIASDGTVYIGSLANMLYAINPDGTQKWSYSAAASIETSPVIGVDGTVYVGELTGNLLAINPNGTLKWSHYNGSYFDQSAPAVAQDGTIYYGASEPTGKIGALNSGGGLKWSYTSIGGIYSFLAIGNDGTLYVTADDGYLYALYGTSSLANSAWPMGQRDPVRNANAASPIYPPIININFAAADVDKVGFAAVGLTTSDFWNGYRFPNVASAAVSNLKWSDSSSSTVGVTVNNAPGQWGNPVSDGMYDGYIYPQNWGTLTVTVTNLPAGIYDFYLYGHGAANDQNAIFSLVSGSIDYGTKATTKVGSTSWNSTAWQEGLQYEVMRGVSVASNQPVTIKVLPDASAYGPLAMINGVQIVPAGLLPPVTMPTTNLMNINFAAADADKVGFAAMGLTTSDFWNGYRFPNVASAAVSNLKWSDSSSSTVGVTVNNAPGQWGNPVSDGMYDGYIYPQNWGTLTVTVTNLPAGTYDFYVYGHGAADDQNAIFNLVSNSIDYGTQATTVVGSASWNTTTWIDGQQYVLFGGVPVASGQPVILNVLPDSSSYGPIAMINGMQIAKRP
ncbi:PQQ-binding-like beta-propeller repeat protein [Pedosphaera parvula]|uniref:SMP-30/Gluconolaconase/LRE domain protein n=1 Tax=Pedosphaera parvula (strain Ellin514) TaxID=320771 RepID=B9XLZ9_PEDPL|nr:PQQ-binding-like beta-propeller repeat protein [Pedosphaera parvula]EEF59127.1 SMP-30/Gluconolaconase/LRE domain protein [Pedosphaera parvula Ellin514]